MTYRPSSVRNGTYGIYRTSGVNLQCSRDHDVNHKVIDIVRIVKLTIDTVAQVYCSCGVFGITMIVLSGVVVSGRLELHMEGIVAGGSTITFYGNVVGIGIGFKRD